MDGLSINAAEAMPLDSASNRDAASDRDASMRQLEKFTTEAKALTAERLSLKTRSADKQRRAEIDEELEIIRGNSEALRVCLALEAEYLRARHSASVTVRTGEAAAAAPVPLQQQPAKAQGFKVPDTKLFPQWSVGGRDEPLDLRRWFLGAERVLQTLRIEVSEWGRVVALILPSGAHQDWLYRYMEENTGAGWVDTVDAFVTAFQQQTSMDLLEAEWEALQQGTMTVNAYYAKFVELCHAVRLDITSSFVVRKFLRHLNPVLHSNLIIHFGGKLEVERVELEVIRRIAQQFEAAVAQQTKTVVAKAAPTKTVTDRQQLQCSYCNIKGHNITTCYKKKNADSQQTATTSTNTSNNNTSHNTYSKFNKFKNNHSNNNTTTTRSSTPTTTTNTTSTKSREYQCYGCGQTGHRNFECPNRK
jgi:hypothetical protein